MKVLLSSDLHLYPHKKSYSRLQNCLDVLSWIFETAKEKQIKHILLLGDLFHEKQKIDVYTYQKSFEIFEKYMDGSVNVYFLLGNHDIWHLNKWDVSSVYPLRSLPNATVINRPCTLQVGEYPISFLPYTSDPAEDIVDIHNDSKHKILCGHCAIDGALLNVMGGVHSNVSVEHDGYMSKMSPEIFKDWDQVFLGHYHAKQIIKPNIEYIGSPLQLSFGEAFTHKEILVYDLETQEKEYVRNNFSPQHFIVPQKDIDKYDLNGNFIQIIMEDLASSDIVELRNEILNNNKVGTLEFKQVEKEEEEDLVDNAKAILFKESEMLEKYIEIKNEADSLDGLNKEKLLTIGRNIKNKEL